MSTSIYYANTKHGSSYELTHSANPDSIQQACDQIDRIKAKHLYALVTRLEAGETRSDRTKRPYRTYLTSDGREDCLVTVASDDLRTQLLLFTSEDRAKDLLSRQARKTLTLVEFEGYFRQTFYAPTDVLVTPGRKVQTTNVDSILRNADVVWPYLYGSTVSTSRRQDHRRCIRLTR
jgi:hypothetical protein